MVRRTVPLLGAYAWKEVAFVTESPHALQRGDKSGGLNQDIDEAFVRAGCLGVSVNYRLSPEVQHPEHVKDVAAAVTWLHRNIAKFGGDPDKLLLRGWSSRLTRLSKAQWASPASTTSYGSPTRHSTGRW
ncbi:hypothetical protein PF010_g21005 [Phytophthora fragariae]|uniref:BD-FAE-like domain-containing protein n=1 Tax=Phytophthora fragariae TaxID=53985 RepID=A0A6A3S0S3_9STRA|nr:hypothetical protein PF007_g22273 [Phytophthora fragariae]KAE9084010.1 hypothetical protein PF010_g21005 [Phytophthora fragariae]KAE9106771.1 hypothetical protein PF006_g21287 [Phytophthora fragariae]KAE9195187.1 hypothetical protein PF004_g20504 [Phytophthora fragariae]KAE9308095.1 hypothetical protein PF008_g21066 [Phytophthora fragariae]